MDRDIVLTAALRHAGILWEIISRRGTTIALQHDETFFLAAVECFRYAPEEHRNDKDVALAAVKQ